MNPVIFPQCAFWPKGLKPDALVACMGSQQASQGKGDIIHSLSPIDGSELTRWNSASTEQLNQTIEQSLTAFQQWRQWPASQRGELVSTFGNIVRQHKTALAELITLETGKVIQESLSEVQDVIDICDFSANLSQQLYGRTVTTEHPKHRMMEHWHPLGVIAIVTTFSFPMATWAWNSTLALITGNSVIWKPSEQTPLCSLALQLLLNDACRNTQAPANISQVIAGDAQLGQDLAAQKAISLVSVTGSTNTGYSIATTAAERLGQSLLELSHNNAMIVSQYADLELAVQAIVFSAINSGGQHCSSLRRVICHHSVLPLLSERLISAYKNLKIGDPREPDVLVGPLINNGAWQKMQLALSEAEYDGGRLLIGGIPTLKGEHAGIYISPAIIEMQEHSQIMQQETFTPLLYLLAYNTLEEAITLQNNVPQNLSSTIFTQNLQEAEIFLASIGSNCRAANVNISTSGAEISKAFNDKKQMGRTSALKSNPDAWKQYMRRCSSTINYGSDFSQTQ